MERLLNLGSEPAPNPAPPPGTPPPPSTPPSTSPPPPTTNPSASSLTFTCIEGGPNPSNQTLSITNNGGGTLNWTASVSEPWLNLSPTGGTTTTETDVITVRVNIAGLTAGTYTSKITITDPGATNASQQVPVTLTLTPPQPIIGQSPTFLTFIATAGGTQPTGQTLNITNTGKGTLSWSASEGASWLSLNPTSGTTSTETDVIAVTANTAGLTTNTYTAPITITATGASNTPQQVLVTLAVTAPVSTKATLTWGPNTESDFSGYKVYVGTSSQVYGSSVDVGPVTTFEVINLSRGQTYYFAVTAYDTTKNESGHSNEVSKIIP
jgi:predicted secreted protein